MIEMFFGSFLGVIFARLLVELWYENRFSLRVEELEHELELLKLEIKDDN